MKILFLDVDGVLNSHRNVIAQGGFPFPKGSAVEQDASGKHREENLDPLAIGMVRRLCDECGVKIVLHSTWRTHLDPEEFGKRWNLPVIDGTKEGDKAASIVYWLNEHGADVAVYAILDDQPMRDPKHQVFTDIEDGMLVEHFNQLWERFK